MPVSAEDAIVVLGTSRSDGNTRATVANVVDGRQVDLIDLSTADIRTYDYNHRNELDEFLPIAQRLAEKSLWLLATLVYWYTMSAQMKVFVDRLSDLITIRKDLGRALRGKAVAVLASGTDNALAEGFEAPFRLTAQYFEMRYLGAFYLPFSSDDVPAEGHIERGRSFGKTLLL